MEDGKSRLSSSGEEERFSVICIESSFAPFEWKASLSRWISFKDVQGYPKQGAEIFGSIVFSRLVRILSEGDI